MSSAKRRERADETGYLPTILIVPAKEKFAGVRENATVELSTPMISFEGNLKDGARGIVRNKTMQSLHQGNRLSGGLCSECGSQ